MSEGRVLLVPEGLEGERVDAAVARMLGLSRSRVADLVVDGGVLLDGAVAAKSDRVRAGAMLEVTLSEPPVARWCADDGARTHDRVRRRRHRGDRQAGRCGRTPESGLERADGARPGWPPASGSPPRACPSARASSSDSTSAPRADGGGQERVRLHRLKRAFRSRTVDKTYHALVQGHPDPFARHDRAPIGRHPTARVQDGHHRVRPDSVTHYETLAGLLGTTLLEVPLETGRTHQIRVHIAAIRHPCVGDLHVRRRSLAGRPTGLERQWLHAVRLGFAHPVRGEQVTFSSDYPQGSRQALGRRRSRLTPGSGRPRATGAGDGTTGTDPFC